MNYAEPLILSVTQLNRYVKARLDEDEHLYNIFLTGEISNFTRHFKTGHLYFTLKDEGAAVKAVMFSSNAYKLKFEPQNGLHVLIRGRVSLYEATGQYQVYVDDMQPEGLGALHLAFEQTKEKLQKLGVFDASHKQPLPQFPKRIGVITSEVGAALQDILNILGRRYPLAEVILAPSRVQGDGAHVELISAIERFNRSNLVDVIILGRGGGSMEDLWEFNHEDLAMAVYHSRIPIVSAVGHETDYTICDFAADLRAPTPSAAAELVVPDQFELKTTLNGQFYRAQRAIYTILRAEQNRFSQLKKQSVLEHKSTFFDAKKMRLAALAEKISTLEDQTLTRERIRLSKAAAKLDALSPLSVLSRGYAITKSASGDILKTVTQLKPGDKMQVQFADGMADCVVEEIKQQ